MNYTLHQLKIFIQVAKYSSITKAADSLFLTQPAISIQLKNFQEQFDVALTENIGKKIYLTDFGRQIEITAKEILLLSENIQNMNLSLKNELIGKINISSVSTGKYVIPYFLTDFFKKHEGLELNLEVTNKESVIENISKNEVDFALVSIPPERIAYESLTILKNKLYLVCHSNFEIPKKINHKIFEDNPLIYRELGSGTRQIMEIYLNKYDIPIRKKLELTSNEAVKQAILAGLGISIMPLIGIKNELNLGQLKIIPMKGLPIESNWMLIWPKGKKHSPSALAYITYLKNNTERIKSNYFKWFEDYE